MRNRYPVSALPAAMRRKSARCAELFGHLSDFLLATGDRTMKAFSTCAIVALALIVAAPANAKGCLKGALIGGAAGHYAGHHGVLGAAAGCVIGRREANKRARLERQRRTAPY